MKGAPTLDRINGQALDSTLAADYGRNPAYLISPLSLMSGTRRLVRRVLRASSSQNTTYVLDARDSYPTQPSVSVNTAEPPKNPGYDGVFGIGFPVAVLLKALIQVWAAGDLITLERVQGEIGSLMYRQRLVDMPSGLCREDQNRYLWFQISVQAEPSKVDSGISKNQ